MSRENEEDVSGIDDIFDDNKDNINKFPKSDETSVSDSDTIVKRIMSWSKIQYGRMEQRKKGTDKMKKEEKRKVGNPIPLP